MLLHPEHFEDTAGVVHFWFYQCYNELFIIFLQLFMSLYCV